METHKRPLIRRGWFVGCVMVPAALVVAILVLAAGSALFMRAKGQAPPTSAMSSVEQLALDEAEAPTAPAEMAKAETGGAPMGASESLLTSAAQAQTLKREIIYTATLTVEVDDVDAAAASVEALIKSAEGWLGSKTVQAYEQVFRETTITMRVPARSFEDVMAKLRAIGDVRSENITAEDVTKQVLDLEARLKNLHREEAVVAELFQREGEIEWILQVERELSRVRGEIEQAQGSLNYLRENVAYSTITITIRPKPTGVERKLDEWSLGWHARRAWRMLVAVVRAIVLTLLYAGVIVGPLVLAALVIWWIVRNIRRARRRTPPDGDPTDTLQP